MEPIFIIGTERSGTNLLRLILNSHSHIAIPHPPHILKNFFKLEPLYGDLRKDINFKQLIKNVIRMIEFHPYPWEIKLDENIIFNSVRDRNLIGIFFAIYEQYAISSGKNRWGCKSTFMINHVALIRHYFSSAKFIYIVRDGRDVAVSAKKSIFNYYSTYFIAKLWKREQQIGIYWLNKLPKESIYLIRYEDLLNNPESSIMSICSFLNEPYEENMINFFNTTEARNGSSISIAWKNISNPIMKKNFGKFKTELQKRDIDLFESIAGYELEYFSYTLTKPFYIIEGESLRRGKFRIIYLLEEILLMLKTQIRYFFNDKNNLLRYKKFLFLKFIKIARIVKWK